jgi:hypothetical protein
VLFNKTLQRTPILGRSSAAEHRSGKLQLGEEAVRLATHWQNRASYARTGIEAATILPTLLSHT